MPIYITSEVKVHWGWSVRIPTTSAGGSSLPLPPPSTLVGMLARSLARAAGWGEMYTIRDRGRVIIVSTAYRLAKYLLAAAAIMEGPGVGFNDVSRQLNTPYLRSEYRVKEDMWFSVQGFGIVSSPSTSLYYALVFDDSIIDGVFSMRDFERAGYAIVNVGSKEGLSHAVNVSVGRVSEGMGGGTKCYAPEDSVNISNYPDIRLVEMWDPRDRNSYTQSKQARKLVFAYRNRLKGYWTPEPMKIRHDYPSYNVGGYCNTIPKLPGGRGLWP